MANFSMDLWRYNSFGDGAQHLQLYGETHQKDGSSGYGFNFNIDPNEKYLVLEKSYLGKPDYGIVIKDVETRKDLFEVNLNRDILEKYPDITPGSLDLGRWLKGDKYLLGDIYDGPRESGFWRLELGTWKLDAFATPEDINAGVERALNTKNLYLAYASIPTFTGDTYAREDAIERARREGRNNDLTVYNLVTKEKKLIASTDREKRFRMKWISDTELEYYLGDGSRKVYEISL